MEKLEVLCLRCHARHVIEDENPHDTSIEFHCTICGLLIRVRLSPLNIDGRLLPPPETRASHRDTRQLPSPPPVVPAVEEPRAASVVKGPRPETQEVSASAILPLSEESLAPPAPICPVPVCPAPLPLASAHQEGVAKRIRSGHRLARACLRLCAPSLIVFGGGCLLLQLSSGPFNSESSTLTHAEAQEAPSGLGAIFTPSDLTAELTTQTGFSLAIEDPKSEPEATPMLVAKAPPEAISAPPAAPARERTARSHKVPSRPPVLGVPLKASTAHEVLQKHGAKLQRCADVHLAGHYRRQEVRVQLQVSVGGNGAVKTLRLSPVFLSTSEFGRCLTDSISHVQFPAHPGPDATFVLPVTVQVNRALHASR
jgi:hypothetical protein